MVTTEQSILYGRVLKGRVPAIRIMHTHKQKSKDHLVDVNPLIYVIIYSNPT